MRGLLVIATMALCTGCFPEVDVEPVPADYKDWYRVDTYGPAPGHGNTYRIIYANPLATERLAVPPGTMYPPGSIIVKEVRELIGEDQPGDINYIAIMRVLMDDDVPDGAELAKTTNNPELEFGWLFTYANASLTSEEYRSSCWDSCHRAAPIDATFIDYSLGYEEPEEQ